MMNLWFSDSLAKVCTHCYTRNTRSWGSDARPFNSTAEPLTMMQYFPWSLYLLNEVSSIYALSDT